MKYLVSRLKPYISKLYKNKKGHLSIIRVSLTVLIVFTVYKIIAEDLVNENTIGAILLAIFSGIII